MFRIVRLRRGSGRQSKQESKRKHTDRPPGQAAANSSFTHVGEEERREICLLRRKGLSTHQIAAELGRSTRTVNKVLREAGLNGPLRSMERQDTDDSGDASTNMKEGPKTKLKEELERMILEGAMPILQEHPDLMLQVTLKVLGVTLPKKTLDEQIDEEIANNPEYRRRLAEHRVLQVIRLGRSEMDIVEEGLDLLFRLVDRIDKGQWARTVSSLGESGELRKTIVESIAAFKGAASDHANGDRSALASTVGQPTALIPRDPPNPTAGTPRQPILQQPNEPPDSGLAPQRDRRIRRRHHMSPEEVQAIFATIPMFSRTNSKDLEKQVPISENSNEKGADWSTGSGPDHRGDHSVD